MNFIEKKSCSNSDLPSHRINNLFLPLIWKLIFSHPIIIYSLQYSESDADDNNFTGFW